MILELHRRARPAGARRVLRGREPDLPPGAGPDQRARRQGQPARRRAGPRQRRRGGAGRPLPGAGLWIVTASLAAAAADTWATSTGGWSRTAPAQLIRWHAGAAGHQRRRHRRSGRSARLVGAASVASPRPLLARRFRRSFPWRWWWVCSACWRLRARRRAPGPLSLRPLRSPHGARGASLRPAPRLTGGLRWLNNDGVNALATAGRSAAGRGCAGVARLAAVDAAAR